MRIKERSQTGRGFDLWSTDLPALISALFFCNFLVASFREAYFVFTLSKRYNYFHEEKTTNCLHANEAFEAFSAIQGVIYTKMDFYL